MLVKVNGILAQTQSEKLTPQVASRFFKVFDTDNKIGEQPLFLCRVNDSMKLVQESDIKFIADDLNDFNTGYLQGIIASDLQVPIDTVKAYYITQNKDYVDGVMAGYFRKNRSEYNGNLIAESNLPYSDPFEGVIKSEDGEVEIGDSTFRTTLPTGVYYAKIKDCNLEAAPLSNHIPQLAEDRQVVVPLHEGVEFNAFSENLKRMNGISEPIFLILQSPEEAGQILSHSVAEYSELISYGDSYLLALSMITDDVLEGFIDTSKGLAKVLEETETTYKVEYVNEEGDVVTEEIEKTPTHTESNHAMEVVDPTPSVKAVDKAWYLKVDLKFAEELFRQRSVFTEQALNQAVAWFQRNGVDKARPSEIAKKITELTGEVVHNK